MSDVTMNAAMATPRATPWAITWLTWPLLFGATLAAIAAAITFHWNLGAALGAITGGAIVSLVTLEFLYPLDPRWRMTLRSFFGRDIKYFIAGGLSGAATNYLFALIGLTLATGHEGPMTHWPVWLAAPTAILAFDFFQYWQHRWSHEADTRAKRFLWRTHAPHHLPEQVYVLMHPAGHPLNFLLLQGAIRIPLFYFLGVSPEALFAATAIIGVQGIFSHCNVDLRTGWFNYLFAGTELHRYHHSADVNEAQNYAVALSLLDVIFGTFVYEPDRVPDRLGVAEPERYPNARQFWRVMLLPVGKPKSA
jgi:sterol desaturase/sphingolipid hydroxylase (fatty acid hydroxylase superfamily)